MKYGTKFGNLMVVNFTKDNRPAKEREGHLGIALATATDSDLWYVFSIYKRAGGEWLDNVVEFDSFWEAHELYNELPNGNYNKD